MFDTKRNIRVQKGRETQERERREREKSEVRSSLLPVLDKPAHLTIRVLWVLFLSVNRGTTMQSTVKIHALTLEIGGNTKINDQ